MKESRNSMWDWMKKLIGGLCFLFATIWYLSSIGIVSANEHQEAMGIADVLRRSYGEDLVFATSARPTRTKLSVYGILEISEQDALVDFLSGKRKKAGWNPIEVQFYEMKLPEATELKDGSVLSIRGDEELLRTEIISFGFGWW